MNTFLLITTLLSFLFSSPIFAADPTPIYGNASTNLILAQQIVYDLLASHPDLLIVGLHGATPTNANGSIIAINLDRIGKADDSDDDAVVNDHKTIMAPNANDAKKWEVATPLSTKGGVMLNASINMVFDYQKDRQGDDLLGLLSRSVIYAKEAGMKIGKYEDLFMKIDMLYVNGSCSRMMTPGHY